MFVCFCGGVWNVLLWAWWILGAGLHLEKRHPWSETSHVQCMWRLNVLQSSRSCGGSCPPPSPPPGRQGFSEVTDSRWQQGEWRQAVCPAGLRRQLWVCYSCFSAVVPGTRPDPNETICCVSARAAPLRRPLWIKPGWFFLRYSTLPLGTRRLVCPPLFLSPDYF